MRRSVWLVASVVLAAAVGLAGCASTGAPTATKAPSGSATTGAGAQTVSGGAKTLNGAGASFPAVLYTKWFNEYKKATGVEVNYQSIGSGGGIKAISDQTVDFGASDAPMTDEQLKAAKGGATLHIPTALGGVAVTYSIPGVTKTLKFTPETLSGIFLGDIKRWNDPKLAADNPDAGLPNTDIVVIHRSDGSGTTNIFTDYLTAVSDKWKSSIGKGTSVNWPVGLGGKGNEGVANEVKQNPNSIGYVEVIYAIQNKLGVAQIKNQAGKFVDPSLDTVTAAAAGVVQTIAPDLRASIVNASGDQAYPISGFTYLLVYEKQPDKAKGSAVVNMLWWAIHDGQQYNKDLGYSPLPSELVSKAESKIRAITFDGQALMK
ncbi:MAG: phosphate ABC transporter substrate-binding protein PstS [Chloroflexota bacterium]